MTQGNSVGVIYLGVTDASSAYRSVLRDKISHIGRLPLTRRVRCLIGGLRVSVKEFVCLRAVR